jgi:hypothetical protein
MRRLSQGMLRGLCLILPIFGALACGDDPPAPAGQAPASPLPDWAQQLCQSWRRPDGSCDQATLMADYGDCLSSQGVPEMERLRKAGVGNRMLNLGRIKATNLCLELRHWVMTEEGRRSQLGGEKRRAQPS